ncbi:MAG: hypothetical protein HRU03_07525 [Nanoarchaeales archaeon]|nr:hypothetical protein [Nanoarchaeales archaeon]
MGNSKTQKVLNVRLLKIHKEFQNEKDIKNILDYLIMKTKTSGIKYLVINLNKIEYLNKSLKNNKFIFFGDGQAAVYIIK